MPSASDNAATTETTGVARKDRRAKRMSCTETSWQRYYSGVPLALTREVSPALAVCELTHLERCSIDVDLARQQHAAYEQVLRDAGYTVHRLPATREMPDSVFIEDSAVVFDEVAILTRPGAE